jgi:hypothetical protein
MDSKLLERIRINSNESKLLERPISVPTKVLQYVQQLVLLSDFHDVINAHVEDRAAWPAVRTELFGGYEAPNVAQSVEALKNLREKLTRQKREDFLLGQQYPGVLGHPDIQRSSVTMGGS